MYYSFNISCYLYMGSTDFLMLFCYKRNMFVLMNTIYKQEKNFYLNLWLVSHNFRNSSTSTLHQLQETARDCNGKSLEGENLEMSPSLHLLLQFQRLLVARIFSMEVNITAKPAETKEEEDFTKPSSEIGIVLVFSD